MSISVIRKDITFLPDSSRVLARFFMSGSARTLHSLAEEEAVNRRPIKFGVNVL